MSEETPNGHVIFVFGDDGRTSFTSYWQDPCWDTPTNRQRTYDFILRHEQSETAAETELRETASELERVRAQLDEATRLLGDGLTWLENWPEPGTAGLVRSYEAFLYRAPAQPYATDMSLPTCPECLLDVPLSKASTESIKAELATRAAAHPTAPEPSAGSPQGCAHSMSSGRPVSALLGEQALSREYHYALAVACQRTESAESKFAEIAALETLKQVGESRADDAGRLARDIRRLLTQPTPGAGTGEDQ